MQNTTINAAIRDFSLLAEQALADDEVINIATDNGNIIMISEDSYRGLLLTAQVNANPEFKQSLIDGMKAPLSDFVPEGEVKW